jgi:hypothetical protein
MAFQTSYTSQKKSGYITIDHRVNLENINASNTGNNTGNVFSRLQLQTTGKI